MNDPTSGESGPSQEIPSRRGSPPKRNAPLQAGSKQTDASQRHTVGTATDRHIEDLSIRCEELRGQLAEKDRDAKEQQEKMMLLSADRARLNEQTKSLRESLASERFENGLGAIAGTILIALGILQVKLAWQSVCVLLGCLLVFWRSIMIGVQSIRRRFTQKTDGGST